MVDVSISKLEKDIKQILDSNPQDTVELRDLSESAYMQFKTRLEENYHIRGIINILRVGGTDKTYTLHIRRK